MFSHLSERLSSGLSTLKGRGRLGTEDITRFLDETRESLLEADVAVEVVEEFIAALRLSATEIADSNSLNPAQEILLATQSQLTVALGETTKQLSFAKSPPTVFMMLGLQGSGKTTLAAKLAKRLSGEGHAPLLVAADLQRPNAVDQLRVVGDQVGVKVFAPEPGNGVGDPVQVATDAVSFANQNMHDVVIIDTAGRLALDEELLGQAKRIKQAVQPTQTLLVIDSMIGQDAVNVGAGFESGVGFDGLVLTKLDGDTRGGAALSLVGTSGKPILFASVGEKLTDLEVFHPDRMASRILQQGDLATLSEQAAQFVEVEDVELQARKLTQGDFSLQDFLDQLVSIKQMGSVSSLVGMLPGAAKSKVDLNSIDDGEIKRAEAIIRSMTPEERLQPRLLDGARRARIAKGAGVQVSEINSLVKRFEQAKTLMQQAQPPQGSQNKAKSHQGRPRPKGKSGSKGRSGNPAKRAAQERERAVR